MEGKQDPLKILHELNSDFQRSKKEQIDRFLRDQDDLNKRFVDCALNSDEEGTAGNAEDQVAEDEDDGDCSSDDVESQFNLRLDTFRVRPLSARIGSWSLEDEDKKSPSKPFATVKLSNNKDCYSHQAQQQQQQQDVTVSTGEYQKYARERSSSRDKRAGSRQQARRTIQNGSTVKERNKSRDRSVRVDKSQEHKTEPNEQEPPQKKLLVRRRHRPRTAMGLQIASRDAEEEQSTAKKESKKSPQVSGTGPSSSRRPLRASAPAAPSRGHAAAGWETAEEMKRNTYLERQSVVRGGRESPALNTMGTMGASVAALHHRNRQQELLASVSVSNLTSSTTSAPADNPSTLRSSLSFGGATPRGSTGIGKEPMPSWTTLATPRHTARQMEPLQLPSSGSAAAGGVGAARGGSSSTQPRGAHASSSTSPSSQGTKLSHRKVGQGGPSEGGAVRSNFSLIKLPRLEGTLPKTILPSKESSHGLVANTPT